MANIVIIGAGASGLMAAISASENKENHVTLLERQGRVGRKILSTGNGRCNLTNTSCTVQNYYGDDAGFAMAALTQFPPQKTIEFFRSIGLLTVEEYGGRVFPKSFFAGSVLDVLRNACEKNEVSIVTDCAVTAVSKRPDGSFEVASGTEKRSADKVIISCGGAAGNKLGGVKDGYDILKSLGHSCTKLYPALTQIRTAPEYPKALKGIRANAALKLKSAGRTIFENSGEVLFTETGVSGTAVFEASRFASTPPFADEIVLDFLPDMSESEVQDYLVSQKQIFAHNEKNRVLTGAVHPRLGMMICKMAQVGSAGMCENLSRSEIAILIDTAKAFTLKITGVSGFEAAQVTAGGIATSQFNPQTLESKITKNLYACGEVLDIDGDCGGYNLQWAWASGALAGRTL